MEIVVVIGINLIMMSVLFVVGIYLFMQVEDKQKRRPVDRLRRVQVVSELGIDEGVLRQLVRDEQYDYAVQHLMDHGEVDRFTAEATVETLKEEEYRPYRTKSDHP